MTIVSDPFDEREILTIQLEKLKALILQPLSAVLIDPQVNFSLYESFVNDDIMMRIKGFVWAEQAQRQEVQYPANWWQAFKERWFPAWLLERWPVEHKKHIFDVKCVYPNFRPSLPEQDYCLHLIRQL